MEFQKVIETRQSIRRFKDRDVPASDIGEIVKAAGMAPSGKNVQCWHFVAVKNQELKDKIAAAIEQKNAEIAEKLEPMDAEKASRFRKFFQSATLFCTKSPVLIVVYSSLYEPSGAKEIEMAGSYEDLLYHLYALTNPGMQSLGAGMENLALKATDLGYGTCWLTSANYASPEIAEVLKEEIGFAKEGWFVAALMALGVPEPGQKSPKKKSVEEILTLA